MGRPTKEWQAARDAERAAQGLPPWISRTARERALRPQAPEGLSRVVNSTSIEQPNKATDYNGKKSNSVTKSNKPLIAVIDDGRPLAEQYPECELSPKESRVLEKVKSGMGLHGAIEAAGVSRQQVRESLRAIVGNARLRPALAHALAAAGVTEATTAGAIGGALVADRVVVTTAGPVQAGPDHNVRLKAAALSLRLAGDLDTTVESDTAIESNINYLQASSNVDPE